MLYVILPRVILITFRTMMQVAKNNGDERLWKIILSPEQGDKVNLKEHAIKFMEQVQKGFRA